MKHLICQKGIKHLNDRSMNNVRLALILKRLEGMALDNNVVRVLIPAEPEFVTVEFIPVNPIVSDNGQTRNEKNGEKHNNSPS